MGDPKYPRRVWRKPKRPLNYELKMEELKALGTFGLRTKRELWKAHTELSQSKTSSKIITCIKTRSKSRKRTNLNEVI